MRIRRILILIFMVFIILLMLALPGASHTKRTRTAYRNYFESRTEQARLALEEAKRLDRRDMLRFELTCALMLAASAWFFIRAKPKYSHTPQQ